MKDDFKPRRSKPAFAPNQIEPSKNTSQEQLRDLGGIATASQTSGNKTPTSEIEKLHKPHQSPKHTANLKWHPKTWWPWFSQLSRNKKIIISSIIVGLLICCGVLAYYMTRPGTPPPPPPPPVVKEEPKPTIIPSPLTGVLVKPELAEMPVTGVMIENSPDARPQSGLYDAGVVYEAIAEGGITRFLALYQESSPEHIGPVRSVRPYYLDFLAPYDAPLGHAGGSGQALAEIRAQNFKDLDHSALGSNVYERVSTRYAPHNLYTSRAKLLAAQKSKGWNTSKFTGFARKEKEEKAATPTASSIDFNISSFYYNAHFDYRAESNSYLRKMGGGPHTDEKARKQINPKVVVALVMSHQYAGIYSVYGVNGSGVAYVFQDGKVTKGTWHKKNRKTQITFTDASKETLKLNPGQTWVTIVSSPGAVTYK